MTQADNVTMLDINNPVVVEVEYNKKTNVLHVNIDGSCRLRVQRSMLVQFNGLTRYKQPTPLPLGLGY